MGRIGLGRSKQRKRQCSGFVTSSTIQISARFTNGYAIPTFGISILRLKFRVAIVTAPHRQCTSRRERRTHGLTNHETVPARCSEPRRVFMIIAKRVPPRLGGLLVKPTPRQQPSHGLDPHRSSTGPLVCQRRSAVESSFMEVIDIAFPVMLFALIP